MEQLTITGIVMLILLVPLITLFQQQRIISKFPADSKEWVHGFENYQLGSEGDFQVTSSDERIPGVKEDSIGRRLSCDDAPHGLFVYVKRKIHTKCLGSLVSLSCRVKVAGKATPLPNKEDDTTTGSSQNTKKRTIEPVATVKLAADTWEPVRLDRVSQERRTIDLIIGSRPRERDVQSIILGELSIRDGNRDEPPNLETIGNLHQRQNDDEGGLDEKDECLLLRTDPKGSLWVVVGVHSSDIGSFEANFSEIIIDITKAKDGSRDWKSNPLFTLIDVFTTIFDSRSQFIAYLVIYLTFTYIVQIVFIEGIAENLGLYNAIWFCTTLVVLSFLYWVRKRMILEFGKYDEDGYFRIYNRHRRWLTYSAICVIIISLIVCFGDFVDMQASFKGGYEGPWVLGFFYVRFFLLDLPLLLFIIHEVVVMFSGYYRIMDIKFNRILSAEKFLPYIKEIAKMFKYNDRVFLWVLVILSLYASAFITGFLIAGDPEASESKENLITLEDQTVMLTIVIIGFFFVAGLYSLYFIRELLYSRMRMLMDNQLESGSIDLNGHLLIVQMISLQGSPYHVPTSWNRLVTNGAIVFLLQLLALAAAFYG